MVKDDKTYQAALAVRKRVFVEEQLVPVELEIDAYEATATHFVVHDEQGQIAGAGRCRMINLTCKAERICVLQTYRGRHVGRMLMEAIEQYARAQSSTCVTLHAQTQVIPFYESLQYETTSPDVFYDAGIPHVTMKKGL